MRALIDFINEAKITNQSAEFFKDWRKLWKIGSYANKWYDHIQDMINKYGLELIENKKDVKIKEQPIFTVLMSKKSDNTVLDVAVTRQSKRYELEGAGTVNLAANTPHTFDSEEDFIKWYKEYRGIIIKYYKFPKGFFDNVRVHLGDKLL